MDEGSQADDEQFSRYFTRFKRIFNHESSSVNMVNIGLNNALIKI